MRGLIILLFFQFLGFGLQSVGVPLPAGVIGLILFTAALFLGLVKLHWVEASSRFLLRHMLLFFVPVIVGVIASAGLLQAQWLPIVASLLISLFATMLVTGFTASALLAQERESVDDRK
jgi:holin-like protein